LLVAALLVGAFWLLDAFLAGAFVAPAFLAPAFAAAAFLAPAFAVAAFRLDAFLGAAFRVLAAAVLGVAGLRAGGSPVAAGSFGVFSIVMSGPSFLSGTGAAAGGGNGR
jgi:hypothetical protein